MFSLAVTFQSRVWWLTTCSLRGQPELFRRWFYTPESLVCVPRGLLPLWTVLWDTALPPSQKGCHAFLSAASLDLFSDGLSSQVPSNPPFRVSKASCLFSFLSFSSVLLLLSIKKGHGASHWSPYSSTWEDTLLSKLALDNCPIASCPPLMSAPELTPGALGGLL